MKTCTVFAVFLMLGTASCGIPTNEATVAVNLGNGTTSSPNTTTDALTSDPSNSTSKTSVQPIKKLGEEGDERRHSSKSPNQRGTNEATVAVNLGNGTTSSPNTTTDALTSNPSNSTSKTSVQPIKRQGEDREEKRQSSKSPNEKDSHTKKIHVEERENSTRSSTTDQNQTANSTRKDNDEGDRGRRRSSITTPTSTVFTVSKVG